ncbi:cytochrome P450 [Pseudonocardia adelaidensis]|uniref:Cytochrome P450 n=1 Tax=Pseudonocardia adelaidensis TaxID=648754 RepID=A0ABP9NIU2_9PSEU
MKSLVSPLSPGYDAFLSDAHALPGFLYELIEEKRQNRGDDLFSDLIAARDGGDRPSEDELTGMAYLLVLAGHETTVNLIANGMLAILTHPDQLALLRAEPERIDAVIEELLRYDDPGKESSQRDDSRGRPARARWAGGAPFRSDTCVTRSARDASASSLTLPPGETGRWGHEHTPSKRGHRSLVGRTAGGDQDVPHRAPVP